MIGDSSSRAGGSTRAFGTLAARRARFRLQCLFLERLDRLVKLRATCLEHEYYQPFRLLDHALYSTYWDCVQLGMRSQARQVLGLSETAPEPKS